ncbi:hypothetical protein RKE29_12085 [Streptomyces sp. B1866]|uniref:DUF6542 domain-containing protein n=1 Tax=Streptomyces sp. B1866 TaxID=3075431 RepID=UPI00288D3E5F|nr:DUF6542 domain-containing protein [Streptomyces sp. B1866]MDT3397378.1 hypothetical protein [Streptomyces sp. B1866]
MEQRSARTYRRTAAPPPRLAADDTADPAERRGVAGLARGRRPERPGRRPGAAGDRSGGPAQAGPGVRLTGLGAGLMAVVCMLAAGCLDSILLSGSPAAYGVIFLLTCTASGLWVRPADLVTSPVGVPIAYAVGLVPVGDDAEGVRGRVMSVFTALSLHAGWLYAGTMLASLIVTCRWLALVSRRRLRQDRPPARLRRPSPRPRSPRC